MFVCTGNRARSPLAEAFLHKLIDRDRVTVISRGTLDAPPAPALPEAVAAGALRGVDLTGHMSASIARGELEVADLVVGFEPFHVVASVVDGGAPLANAFTILEFVEILERLDQDGFLRRGRDPAAVVARAHEARRGPVLSAPALADPIGSPQKEFDRLAVTIERLVRMMARGFVVCH